MNVRSLIACSLVLAAFAARAADVVLTEDLVITNQFSYETDKPLSPVYTMSDTDLISGGNGQGVGLNIVTIPNARYDQVEPLFAKHKDNQNEAKFFNRKVFADYIEYQAQMFSDPSLLCAFIKFEQDGDNVKVSAPRISNGVKSDTINPGCDMSVVVTPRNANADGYGIKGLVYRVLSDDTAKDGTLTASPTNVLDDVYSGTGGIVIKDRDTPFDATEYTIPDRIQYGICNCYVISNAVYNNIVPVKATGDSTYFTGTVYPFHLRDYGTYSEVQFQWTDGGTVVRALWLRFTQHGANVHVTTVGEASDAYSTGMYGRDISRARMRYGLFHAIKDFVYRLDGNGSGPSVTLDSVDNTYTGLTVVDHSKLTMTKVGNVLPAADFDDPASTKGVIVVTNGAELVLAHAGDSNGMTGKDGWDIRVAPKGKVTGTVNWPISMNTHLSLDDAEFAVNTPDNIRCCPYFLTLANGSRLTGKSIRPGHHKTDFTYLSTGDLAKTNVIEQNVCIMNGQSSIVTFHIVTEADFQFAGGLSRSTDLGGTMTEVVKEGDRSFILEKGSSVIDDRVTFVPKAGTFYLNGSFCSANKAPKLRMDGGTLTAAANTTTFFTEASLAAGGTIDVAAGTTFNLGVLGTGWDAGENKVLVRYADKDTSSVVMPQLTAAQRVRVKIQVADGKVCNVMQDENGRLIPVPQGLMLILR